MRYTEEEASNELQRRCNGLNNAKHVMEVALQIQKEIYNSLEARIAELEAHNRELAKEFTHSKYVDLYVEPKMCETCITHNYANSECDLLRYLPEYYRKDFGCIKYTPMEKS